MNIHLGSNPLRVKHHFLVKGGLSIYNWIDTLLRSAKAIPPDTMSASLAVRILRAAVAEGGNRRDILSAVGLEETRLRNPLSRISNQVAIRLFKVLQRHFNDPSVHLRLGKKAVKQNFADFGYAAQLESDLAAVIEAHVQLQPLRQNMFRTTFHSMGQPPYLSWEYSLDLIQDYASFVEFSVMTFARLSRQILNESPLLLSVYFQHQPQFDLAIYEASFGCPVEFGMPQTRMEIAGRQVFRPSPFANKALLEAACERNEQAANWMVTGRSHLAFCYFYLANELDKAPPTLDRMAESFGMSERTLRRNLVDQGMSFRDLLNVVRRDMCKLYFMENTHSLGEIALLLGYSDLSAFTRAYKTWTGKPPSRRGGNPNGELLEIFE